MIQFSDQELVVSGKIDYDNAEDYYVKGLREIQSSRQFPIVVNLAALENGSTLALAVLIRWLRQTPQAKGLQFKAVPAKMMNIIQACHLENDLQII
ncbi:STAS domain-containing protein [Acinetobacter wanghuae]|uniref:STAS domain-containing protein n=1 Tax=Acinetobacter wanghuae TaxID=2662362 RepID=A0A5Q0P5B7_9GAMM|nr:STAS domain-containing protein [Acinetobacter wanghuae]MQW92430.1 STAS domain-containing protein [Acinetobacter wanghuae]QGA11934.1 STAS domain-containing protein [Acinetobacter wanghuae]